MKEYEKKKIIFADISKNMLEFEKQARIKLVKRRHLLQTNSDHLELVSDILFSVFDKLDKEIYIEKFYNMVLDDQLKLYIFKGIDRNCTSFTAPFLRNKLAVRRISNLDKDIVSDDSESRDSDTLKLDEMSDKNKNRLQQIDALFQPPIARELFGSHYKYFIKLFKEYIAEPDTTYKSLGIKYGVPTSSINAHFQILKRIIKNNISYDEKNN